MRPLHFEIQRRRSALYALLALTLPCAAVLTGLNLQRGAAVLATLSLVLLVTSIWLLFALRRGAKTHPLAMIYLPVFLAAMLPVVARPDIHPGAASWVAVTPVLPFLVLPINRALPMVGLSFCAAFAAYFFGAELAPYRLDPMLLGHISIPALGLVVTFFFYARSRVHAEEHMLERIYTDSLTGLWNRAKLMGEFDRELDRARRAGLPLSLILIDLDHFKQLNDRHGHDAGDAALKYVAQLLKHRMREADLLCRIGGEEFAVLLPGVDADDAVMIAEKLRHDLASNAFGYQGEHVQLTLSAGVVELGRDGGDWSHLYRAADARLYACKERGRNCVLN